MSVGSAIRAVTPEWISAPQPKKQDPNLAVQAWSLSCRTVYGGVDALDRIRRSCDGLDKSLKLASSLCVGAQLLSWTDHDYFGELGGTFRHIDSIFSGISVFGRWNDMLKLDKHGHRAITHKSEVKQASVAFLTIAKSFEFIRMLKTLGLVTSATIEYVDVQILGGLGSSFGQCVLFRVGFEVSLAGAKNFFLVLSSTYAIINDVLVIVDWKADSYTLNRAMVGTGQNMGKIYLATAAFTISGTWVAIAVLTSILGLTKILLDSYENSRRAGQPFEYPKWMLIT